MGPMSTRDRETRWRMHRYTRPRRAEAVKAFAFCWSTGQARIHAAKNLDELEAIRVDVLGRKGSLAQFSKEFGKLTPEERSSAGKALNAAKQSLESAFDERKQAFAG